MTYKTGVYSRTTNEALGNEYDMRLYHSLLIIPQAPDISSTPLLIFPDISFLFSLLMTFFFVK